MSLEPKSCHRRQPCGKIEKTYTYNNIYIHSHIQYTHTFTHTVYTYNNICVHSHIHTHMRACTCAAVFRSGGSVVVLGMYQQRHSHIRDNLIHEMVLHGMAPYLHVVGQGLTQPLVAYAVPK